jgi:hypothetical protein
MKPKFRFFLGFFLLLSVFLKATAQTYDEDLAGKIDKKNNLPVHLKKKLIFRDSGKSDSYSVWVSIQSDRPGLFLEYLCLRQLPSDERPFQPVSIF